MHSADRTQTTRTPNWRARQLFVGKNNNNNKNIYVRRGTRTARPGKRTGPIAVVWRRGGGGSVRPLQYYYYSYHIIIIIIIIPVRRVFFHRATTPGDSVVVSPGAFVCIYMCVCRAFCCTIYPTLGTQWDLVGLGVGSRYLHGRLYLRRRQHGVGTCLPWNSWPLVVTSHTHEYIVSYIAIRLYLFRVYCAPE